MYRQDFLALSHLAIGYHRKVVLQDLNLSGAECELIALIGRNGIGKSTLMRTIARMQPALSGEILIDGKPLIQYSRNELACLLSIVSTESVSVSHLTVRQFVAYGRFPYTNWIGKLTEQDKVLVEEAMQLVHMAHLADKNLYEISDGERQRAMIARTLAQDTKVILLDEPTAFLDMPNKYEVIRLLCRLTRQKKKTIIFSTHDLNIAMQEADKLWLMVDEHLYEGAPEDLVLDHRLARVFEGTKLQFDDHTGEFKIKHPHMHSIHLTGNGRNYFWTQRALERMGYVVNFSSEAHCDTIRIFVSDASSPDWTLSYGDHHLSFSSIYHLSQHLLMMKIH